MNNAIIIHSNRGLFTAKRSPKFAVNKVTIIWSHREAIHIKEVKAVCCVQGHLSLINLEYATTCLTYEKWSWLRLQNPNMGSFLDILDTQKKSEFQVIPNFKDSEFEETKCSCSMTCRIRDNIYFYNQKMFDPATNSLKFFILTIKMLIG